MSDLCKNCLWYYANCDCDVSSRGCLPEEFLEDDLPPDDRLDDRFCFDDDEPFDVITLGDLSAD